MTRRTSGGRPREFREAVSRPVTTISVNGTRELSLFILFGYLIKCNLLKSAVNAIECLLFGICAFAAGIRRHAEHVAAHGGAAPVQPHAKNDPTRTIATAALKPERLYSRWSDSVLLVVALLALWQIASSLLSADGLPVPWLTFVKLKSIMHDDDFFPRTYASPLLYSRWASQSRVSAACVASQSGIGHVLIFAVGRNDKQSIMALAILLFVFATVVNLLPLK